MPRKEKVTGVIDGDTFTTDRRKNSVRLANVDAPELSQRDGPSAKKALEKMILGKEVWIDTKARDKYARSVANVKQGRNSVNKAMRERLK